MDERFVDLHTHSDRSDGSLSPRELVRHAKESGLCAIALSDHDTMAGVADALDEGARVGLEVVPAIELSARGGGETHILGYYPDPENAAFKAMLARRIEARREKSVKTAKLLQALGFDVTAEEADAIAPGSVVGRAHYARLLFEKGYVSSVKEGFEKYLGIGKPAYFSNQIISPAEAVRLIKDAGGAAYLAHPHKIDMTDEELDALVRELAASGLDGIEGYYTEYTPEMERKYRALAAKYGIGISGGSDFHGKNKPHIAIGRGMGNLRIPYSVLEGIKTRV